MGNVACLRREWRHISKARSSRVSYPTKILSFVIGRPLLQIAGPPMEVGEAPGEGGAASATAGESENA